MENPLIHHIEAFIEFILIDENDNVSPNDITFFDGYEADKIIFTEINLLWTNDIFIKDVPLGDKDDAPLEADPLATILACKFENRVFKKLNILLAHQRVATTDNAGICKKPLFYTIKNMPKNNAFGIFLKQLSI